ncbi:DNA-processing protein DprA [Patescibacteria group bacterium]|nr:DNA-processing protein DprA [Patescibacteria group bacterium]MBU1246900.1 DNA-processing protein DprA [Patescibacteria group bacterium]MBU1519392.1 DNA-processing protein DprA [Patescibacteria group bacterium]MBU1730301.1 DNA-processing protein DprA [Patescibacteria group bacterium]MBU1956231.1 DNA-processing protein DprA [Patescibacteria group bacterium]
MNDINNNNRALKIRQLDRRFFPVNLLEIPQPPKTLFMLGQFPTKNTKFLTVVGSRKFSNYGKEACERIIEGLRGYNISIVSGLALGMDSIAHKTALSVGLHTIAIPGSGLQANVLYPSTNRYLAEKIVASGGALLSEFEPDFCATKWSFPQRNRIMAGISDAVLIIEAAQKSGTLITARMAVDYNKTVLAVPGSIFSDNSKGTNQLITQGATPISTSDDVLLALGIPAREAREKDTQNIECSPEEVKILAILTEPMPRDLIIAEMRLPTETTNSLLSLLEIKGLIKEQVGKIYPV